MSDIVGDPWVLMYIGRVDDREMCALIHPVWWQKMQEPESSYQISGTRANTTKNDYRNVTNIYNK